MDLVRDIDKDHFKQALMQSFVVLSRSTNIKIIAEGIETKVELETLIKLGVNYGQGYYLARPSEELVEPSINTKRIITDTASKFCICNYDSNFQCTSQTACHYLSA